MILGQLRSDIRRHRDLPARMPFRWVVRSFLLSLARWVLVRDVDPERRLQLRSLREAGAASAVVLFAEVLCDRWSDKWLT